MIRKYVKNIIFESLNYDIFRLEDFCITEENSEKECKINIGYDNYYYIFLFTNSDSEDIKVYLCPGKIHDHVMETISIFYFEDRVKSSIQEWLKRIKCEIYTPAIRNIDDRLSFFTKELNEKLNDINDEFFNKKDGDDLKERLEKLESVILSKNIEDANDELKIELEKMKREIEFLKDTVDKFSKKRWLRTAMLKFWAWKENPENKEIIKIALDIANHLAYLGLPEIKL